MPQNGPCQWKETPFFSVVILGLIVWCALAISKWPFQNLSLESRYALLLADAVVMMVLAHRQCHKYTE